MKTFTVKVNNPAGLHARPATFIAAEASKFKSDLQLVIDKNGKFANLKSVMNIIALTINKNDTITVKANGDDEDKAIQALHEAFKVNEII
ncbi:HPr family phosphocarrier protein [Mycoplasmopsis gallinarum]|uniref:Phosphocarrier protein HPr n=1 Tax=Mycoplasmopsis gallinarum TaxID=29557 RepID=A0A168RH96_9BACT|nr:HPr family phosphocarrier protein [Mycoplasmopsis gallinarum]OAB48986.1 Phosphotransferase system, phosphocarrierprotein HPr [Mycoplasmopsis gallinarum]